MSITHDPSQPPVTIPGLNATNVRLAHASPPEIIEHVHDVAACPVISTNFRPLSIALVHLVNRIIPGVPVLWVDHGYNTPETLAFVREVTDRDRDAPS